MLQGYGDVLVVVDVQGCQFFVGVLVLYFMYQVDEDLVVGGVDGMVQGDGVVVDVDFFVILFKQLIDGQCLDGKSFVGFDKVYFVQCLVGVLQCLVVGVYWVNVYY